MSSHAARIARSARREQAEETRERVLEAAARLFAVARIRERDHRGHRRRGRCLARDRLRRLPQQADATRRAHPRCCARGATRRRYRCRPARAPSPPRPTSGTSCGCSRPTSAVGWSESARSSRCSRPRLAASPSSRPCSRRSMGSGSRTCARSSPRWRPTDALRLESDAALDTVWALASPDLHRLLTRTRGWTREQYCDWLAESLATLLLRHR